MLIAILFLAFLAVAWSVLLLGIGQSTVGVDLLSSTDGNNYASFCKLRDLNGPEMTANSSDASALNSASGWKEFVAGMKDGGEVTLTMIPQMSYDLQDHIDLLGVCQYWKISVPYTDCSGAEEELEILFQAFITKIGPKFEYDGVYMQDVSIKVTGAVTANVLE